MTILINRRNDIYQCQSKNETINPPSRGNKSFNMSDVILCEIYVTLFYPMPFNRIGRSQSPGVTSTDTHISNHGTAREKESSLRSPDRPVFNPPLRLLDFYLICHEISLISNGSLRSIAREGETAGKKRRGTGNTRRCCCSNTGRPPGNTTGNCWAGVVPRQTRQVGSVARDPPRPTPTHRQKALGQVSSPILQTGENAECQVHSAGNSSKETTDTGLGPRDSGYDYVMCMYLLCTIRVIKTTVRRSCRPGPAPTDGKAPRQVGSTHFGQTRPADGTWTDTARNAVLYPDQPP